VTRAAPFGFTKVVFLSHVVGDGGPVFPGDPAVEIRPAATIERDGADTSFRANQLLLAGHRIHLENLAGLSEMPPAGGWIIVGGIRIRAGSGSPATVFGLIP